MGRGALVVFEGADRSGKSTQSVRCTAALRSAGIPVVAGAPWRFPDRTTATGTMINAYLTNKAELDDHVLHLLFSANRWEKVKAIRAALANGETVILDRYAYSGVAYSAAKGLPFDWCKACDAGLPAPDITLYMDIPLHVALQRGHFGKERYENKHMQAAVAEQFRAMKTLPSWQIVDADGTQDEVFDRVMNIVLPIIAIIRANSPPVACLW